ncbi:hypothetical protein C1H46_033579 [Malus baccata]|uniref:Uncharacterized protein n=1 Tax=Malus baccata TaxID=106549 RepID=A0A540L2W2_MALBA|nr:hypothetical protein C1H46_033579 [Malus baccata]
MEYVSVPQPFSGTAVATVPHRLYGGLELAASSNQTPQDETYVPAWEGTISAMNHDQLIPVNRAKAYRKASTPQRSCQGQTHPQTSPNSFDNLRNNELEPYLPQHIGETSGGLERHHLLHQQHQHAQTHGLEQHPLLHHLQQYAPTETTMGRIPNPY